MFLEIVDPRIIDDMSTRDRVKIRIAEPGSEPRFWTNLAFYNREDLGKFADKLKTYATFSPPQRV